MTSSRDGWDPNGSLVQDAAGNLYGTTYVGGGTKGGMVYKLDSRGKLTFRGLGPTVRCAATGLIRVGKYAYGSVLGTTCLSNYTFQMAADGSYTRIGSPANSILAADSAGNIYGTTGVGNDPGTVLKFSPNGNGGWNGTTLYEFCQLRNCTDGSRPYGPVAIDGAGNIYGATSEGGDYPLCGTTGCGVVFKLDPRGNETVLHEFTDGVDGAFPTSGLTMDSAGNLYGVAPEGGDLTCRGGSGCGVVFKITP